MAAHLPYVYHGSTIRASGVPPRREPYFKREHFSEQTLMGKRGRNSYLSIYPRRLQNKVMTAQLDQVTREEGQKKKHVSGTYDTTARVRHSSSEMCDCAWQAPFPSTRLYVEQPEICGPRPSAPLQASSTGHVDVNLKYHSGNHSSPYSQLQRQNSPCNDICMGNGRTSRTPYGPSSPHLPRNPVKEGDIRREMQHNNRWEHLETRIESPPQI